MSARYWPKANKKTKALCKALKCGEKELLNIMVHRFGDILPDVIKADNHGYVSKWSIRKWLENNGGEDRRSVGAGLKAMRERAGLTQQQVADQVGCSRSAIKNIEMGQSASPEKVAAIREILCQNQKRI